MLNLVRAEWLKLTRRPLAWILLAIFLVLLALQQVAQVVFGAFGQLGLVDTRSSGTLPFGVYQRMSVFPGIFATIFSHINGLGGVFAVILAAGAMGSEYSWGTLRTQLGRQPNRVAYLLAKLVTILLMLLVAMVIALVFGVGVGWGLASLVDGAGAPDAATLAVLPIALLRALYVLLPYVLLTVCFAIVGRSLLAGVAGGLVYLVFEAGFGVLAIFAQLGGVLRLVYDLMLVQNISTLTSLNLQAFGISGGELNAALRPELLPSPLQASIVVGVYSLLFLATALHFFVRRDVSGPT